jgi:hypothetical protein
MAKTLTVALLALAFAAVAPAAAHAKTFKGKTNQGRSASVTTGADGVPTRVRISYSARSCKGHVPVVGVTRYQAPFDSVSATALHDAGTNIVKSGSRKGESARITSSVTAKFQGGHWSGTYRVKLVIRFKGKTQGSCEAKRISWSAK